MVFMLSTGSRRHAEVAPRRDSGAIAATIARATVLWTARRVQFDRRTPCACGAPRKIISERAITGEQILPDWSLVEVGCAARCMSARVVALRREALPDPS